MREGRGKMRGFWLPEGIDQLTDEVRLKLGFSRSNFYRYAVIHLLQEMGALSSKVKREEAKNIE